MIKLDEKRTELVNLKTTINALDDIDDLIDHYSADASGVFKPGPAYCMFKYIDGPGEIDVQFNRAVILTALQAQRAILVEYLGSLGIEV